MLSKDIQEFINTIRLMNKKHPEHAIGCLLVPQKDIKKLTSALDEVDVLIGKEIRKGRVTYYTITKKTNLDPIIPPALLLVTEEDYSSDRKWAQTIRDKAAYFMHVEG